MAAGVATATSRTLRVGLCSSVAGLRGELEAAFKASRLGAQHALAVEEVQDAAAAAASEAEVVLADPGKVSPLLDGFRKLRWLQSSWAGVNVLAAHSRRDYRCTRLTGCFGPQMSEFVFGAIFDEDFARLRDFQEKQEWAPEPFKKRLRLGDLTLGLLGVGEIASTIAHRGQAFGMRTVGYASRAREVQNFDKVSTDLPQVLSEADVIVNVLPSTGRTRGLLDNEGLKACGSSKLFINVGRGDVVAEASLLQALEHGWLRRAVLDVFATEPLPPSSALWKHQGVRITPHIAAVTYPADTAKLFVENLARWTEGEPLLHEVDLDKGY